MNRTQNLQLPQWEANDRVTRAEVNVAFAKLDGALRCATGSYVGTGGYGSGAPTSLTLPFPPKLLLLGGPNSDNYCAVYWPELGTFSYSFAHYTIDHVTVSADGCTLTWYSDASEARQFSAAGVTYRWLCIG